MAGNIIFSIVGKLAGFAMSPIWCQFENLFCYDSKIETLRDKVKYHEINEAEVQQLVIEAKRNAETIKYGVTDWLKKVDDLKKQAYEVFESETNFEMQCLFFICPNLKTRYFLGLKAIEKTFEVVNLQDEGTLF
ncbi:disease resistance At4g27190-like [Olea europaea subsp. europaea]|uniref:Disease resistance At4g27190-like n=1 Tax=Olea europaea subsp. europaea TaxID=158383 RepID=A0A8S0S3I2_OLEEU|nr:disease resistance At4g27190-like [Olea europaea subsp. europaea]